MIPVSIKKVWTISIAAGILLVVGVLASLFGAGIRMYEVKTPSMGTVAPVGTMVVTHPESSYAIGDVVTYVRNGRSYTHRIVNQTAQGFITQGDINSSPDALPVPAYEIVGKVVFYGKCLGFLVQGLPAIFIGWTLVYAITLLPRVRSAWRWHIRLVGWSLVVSIVALFLRPWVNLDMLGYVPAEAGGVNMHLVNTGIFPVSVLGKVISSGQDVVVNQAVLDPNGHYTVIPQLALNLPWFLLLLLICLTPMIGSLFIRVDDDRPEVVPTATTPEPSRPVIAWGRITAVSLAVVASVLAVVLILQLNTSAAFAATIKNSTDSAGTRTWFTCTNAETKTSGALFVWDLTTAGTQSDLTADGTPDGTMTTVRKGTAAAESAESPCPRDNQGSLMFSGATCIYTNATPVNGTETYSEEVWFKTNDKSLNGKLMGFANNITPASQTAYDRHIYIDPTGRVVFGVYVGGQYVVSSPAGTDYANNEWHHVVATSALGKIALYLDGKLVGSRSDTAGQDVSFKGYWEVGCGLLADWQDASGTPRAFSSYFTGNLRLAAVYNRTLTATEVQEHYLAGTN